MSRSSSLSARGGALRTFGGLASFAVLALFGCGAYLLEQQFANPLGAEPAALLFAAFQIATAVILAAALLPASRKLRSGAAAKHR